MKKTHLLPSLLLILLASCQYHGLRLGLTEDEIKTTSLEELLKGEGLDEAKAKEEMRNPSYLLLIHAAGKGWLSVVHKLLLQGVDVDSKDESGWTPLHKAARYGHTAIVKLLLEKGATVDSKGGYDDDTPLQRAAGNGHTAIVKLLLEKGATVDSKNNNGDPPLHRAAQEGHTGVASLLLCHGADLTITNNNGETALQWAQLMEKPETTAFLELAAGKSKEWLETYYEGFTYKQQHTEDIKKVHTYARVYAELCEEDPENAFTAMPYYFKYLEEDKMSHEDAKLNAIGMAHVL